jgi:hypothetical protein
MIRLPWSRQSIMKLRRGIKPFTSPQPLFQERGARLLLLCCYRRYATGAVRERFRLPCSPGSGGPDSHREEEVRPKQAGSGRVRPIKKIAVNGFQKGITTYPLFNDAALKYPRPLFEIFVIGFAGEADKKLSPLAPSRRVRKKL